MNCYDVDKEVSDMMFNHFRISSNAIYPFRTTGDGRICFLRLSPLEEKAESEVTSEIQIIEWLIEQGYPAMKPYPMKDGRLSAVIETEWGTYNVSCFEQVKGKTLDDCDGSPELVKGYGRMLGWLHRLIKSCPYAETRRDHNALMDEIHERFTAYNAPSALLNEWESVRKELAELPTDAEH